VKGRKERNAAGNEKRILLGKMDVSYKVSKSKGENSPKQPFFPSDLRLHKSQQ